MVQKKKEQILYKIVTKNIFLLLQYQKKKKIPIKYKEKKNTVVLRDSVNFWQLYRPNARSRQIGHLHPLFASTTTNWTPEAGGSRHIRQTLQHTLKSGTFGRPPHCCRHLGSRLQHQHLLQI